MNHQPYEEWLFSYIDKLHELSPQQVQELKSHVQGCESCSRLASAWGLVVNEMRQTPLLEPAPGFKARWQERQRAEQKRVHLRQSIAMLGFSLGGASLVFGSLLMLSFPWLRAPRVLLLAWLYRMFTLAVYVEEIQQAASPIFQSLAGMWRPLWWVFLIGIITELTVLWVVSFRLATNLRRVAS